MDDTQIMGWLYKHIPEDDTNSGWVADLRKVTGITYHKQYASNTSYGNGNNSYWFGLVVEVFLIGGQVLDMYYKDNAEGMEAVKHLEQFWISVLQSECR